MVGNLLKSEREKKEIALQAVARETKIGTYLLQCIESNRFDELPGGIYRTSMIKSYARFLGLDPQRVIELYRASAEPEVVELPQPPPARRPLAVRFFALLALIGVAVSTSYLLLEVSGARSSGARLREHAPPPAPAPAQLIAATTTAPQIEPSPLGEEIHLSIRVDETCWASIRADGARLENRLLEKGEELEYRAKSRFQCVFGNAGGLVLSINGEPQSLLGRSHQVKQIAIERQGDRFRLQEMR